MANPRVVVGVASGNERDGDEVMAQHLPMVLPALFHVDDNDLLQPKRPLRQQIHLHDASELPVGPIRPELSHVEPVGGVIIYVLV